MKKRTTLLLSAAVALVSATALTAGVDFTSLPEMKMKKEVKQATQVATVGEQEFVKETLTAHEFNGNIASAMRGAKKAKAGARKKIAAASELYGDYQFAYPDYYDQDTTTGEYAIVESFATIAEDPSTENSILISGVWSYQTEELQATVDVENSTITIPRQQIYAGTSLSLDFVNASDTTADVVGVIDADGVISLQNAWGVMEEGGEFYAIGLGGEFTPVHFNATMALNSYWNGESEIGVTVTMNDDYTATIENFAGYGTVTVNLLYGNEIEIPQQTVGDYYTSYLDHSSGSWYLGASTIKGSGTETVLTIDANDSDKLMSFLTTAGNIGNAFTSAVITLNADAGFTFLYPEEEPVLPGNAVMTVTNVRDGEQKFGVTVTMNDDYTVTVEDFAGIGTATLNMKYGNKVEMPQQEVGGYTTSYLYINGGYLYLGETTIKANGTETVITFTADATDNIISFLNGTSIYARLSAAEITLNEDAGFTFLYPESEPDMSSGTGTEDDPFLIATPEDLEGFIYQVNENGKTYADQFISVVADIDASGIACEPIGSADVKFAGTFDGGNFTIDGVSVSGDAGVGFFAYNNGVIKNLNLTNLNVEGNSYVGGVVGYNYATAATVDDVVVENCSVDNGNGWIYGSSYVGGVVGYNQGTVRGCLGDEGAYVVGTTYTGGIVGYQMRGKIESCVNSGYIIVNGNPTEATGAGGIAGVAANGSTIDYVMFDGVLNGYRYATNTACGGILGRANGSANSKITVSNAFNYGTVYADSIAGGIVGSANQLLLSDSENNATVYGLVKTEGNIAYAGGLIGHSLSSTVEYCKSAGDIEAFYLSGSSTGGVAGGLIGYCAAGVATKVSNSFNVAAIYGPVEAGGVLGQGGGVFTNVYNAGTVNATEDAIAGGFVGLAQNKFQIAGGYSINDGVGNGLVGSVAEGAEITVDASFVTDFGAEDEYGTPVTVKDLAAYSPELAAGSPRHLNALDDEDAWEYGDDYTMPVLALYANDEDALANAAAVVLTGENDTYDNVTDVMNVGTPEGASWEFSSEVLAFDNNNPNQVNILEASTDEVTMTVTAGNSSKAWTVKLNTTKPMTAIDAINANAKDVKSVRYFDVNGRESSVPFDGINIVVKTMTDGKTEVVKAVK